MASPTRVESAPVLITWEEIKQLNNQMGRIQAKLEALDALKASHEALEERVRSLELAQASSSTATTQRSDILVWVLNAAVLLLSSILASVPWWHSK